MLTAALTLVMTTLVAYFFFHSANALLRLDELDEDENPVLPRVGGGRRGRDRGRDLARLRNRLEGGIRVRKFWYCGA